MQFCVHHLCGTETLSFKVHGGLQTAIATATTTLLSTIRCFTRIAHRNRVKSGQSHTWQDSSFVQRPMAANWATSLTGRNPIPSLPWRAISGHAKVYTVVAILVVTYQPGSITSWRHFSLLVTSKRYTWRVWVTHIGRGSLVHHSWNLGCFQSKYRQGR